MKKAILIAAACAGSFVLAQTPAGTPLAQAVADSKSFTPAAAKLDQLAKRLPLLAQLPAKTSFCVSFQDAQTYGLSVEAIAVSITDDMEAVAKLLSAATRGSTGAEASGSAQPPLHLAPIYAVASLKPGSEAAILQYIESGFNEACQSMPEHCKAVTYKDWKGVSFDVGAALSEEPIPFLQAIIPFVKGLKLQVIYRLEGNLLQYCICEKFSDMAWPSSASESLLTHRDLPVLLPAGKETPACVLLADRKLLASVSRAANAGLTDVAPSSDIVTAIVAGMADKLLDSLSGRDLSLAVTPAGQSYIVRAAFGLKGVRFTPGELSIPKVAARRDMLVSIASTGLKTENSGSLDDLTAIFRTTQKGLTMAMRIKTDDAAQVVQMLTQDPTVDPGKGFLCELPEMPPLQGKLNGKVLTLSTGKKMAAAIDERQCVKVPFCGVAFAVKPSALPQQEGMEMDLPLPIAGDLKTGCITGTLSDDQGTLILDLRISPAAAKVGKGSAKGGAAKSKASRPAAVKTSSAS